MSVSLDDKAVEHFGSELARMRQRIEHIERDCARIVAAVDRIEAQGEKMRRWIRGAMAVLRHVKWE